MTHQKHKHYVLETFFFDALLIHIGWAMSYLRERDPEDPRLEDMRKYLTLMLQSMYILEDRQVG